MVVESGLVREKDRHYELTGLLPPLAIPATLQDSLMSRLDRLAMVREVAQVGATVGREFSYELLQAVWPGDEATLQSGLAHLVDAEFLYQRGLLPQARYFFKHALIQETAYQSLLRSKRQQYHSQIAQVLTERFAGIVEAQPELVAHHYTEAGLIEQAIPYWQRAGQRALERSANIEAIRHLTKGLTLLQTLPDTPERTRQELALQMALGVPMTATKGYTAPEVEETYTRARTLCQQLGETSQLVSVLHTLVVFYFNRGELQTAHELAQQMMRLAQGTQAPYLLSVAHGALGWPLYLLGELPAARTHLEQALALYDPQSHPRTAVVNTADLRVECLTFAAWTLWTLGYPDQGLRRINEAVALARGLSHPFSLAFALGCAAYLHLFRREGQLARELAETVIALATEQGFPHFLAFGTMVRGWALAEQGQGQEGIAQMRQSQATFLRAQLLAEAYGKGGQGKEGLTVLAKALSFVETQGPRVWGAELYRLKGQLILQSESQSSESPVLEAEACFQKAIAVARRQSAKSWELRAATSLARLRQQRGKKDEARQMLAEVYGWFTEGFDTKDLQEAKALLEELT
jgi:predicted ATPase